MIETLKGPTMWRNYLKIALRNLAKDKLFSAINLFGLSIGLAACLTIFVYVRQEANYDRFHSKSERIYRVSRSFIDPEGLSETVELGAVAPPFAPLLKAEISGIEQTIRFLEYDNVAMQREDLVFLENDLFFTEENVFDIFDIKVKEGNPKTALREPFSVMLSEEMAKKYFPQGNYQNQEILLFSNKIPFRVTGVYESLPANSHMHPRFLFSFSSLNDERMYGKERLQTNWFNNAFYTYLLLSPDVEPETISSRFDAFLDKHLAAFADSPKPKFKPHEETQLHLQALTDIHLDSHTASELEENGSRSRVWMFALIALFILGIAGANYMNLSTAKAATRAREIGVRKASGANRVLIIRQFLGESVFLAAIATFIGLVLTNLGGLKLLSLMSGKNYTLNGIWHWQDLLLLAGFPVLIGVLAGLYPAFFLSAFRPVEVLKGNRMAKLANTRGAKVANLLRKSLVVGQFAMSAGLIIATLVVFKQLRFIQNKELGYDRDYVVTLPMFTRLEEKFPAMREEFLGQPGVINAGRSSQIPTERLLNSYGQARVGSSKEPVGKGLQFVTVDFDFVSTLGIPLLAGRTFTREHPSDSTQAYLLNETAAINLGWKNPKEAVGQQITYNNRPGEVIGVMKDFHFESLHENILPLIFFPDFGGGYSSISVKMKGDNLPQSLAGLESAWKKVAPDLPFSYNFLDASYNRLYAAELSQGRLFTVFALLAILVACLGLFGLAAFTTQQRVKEIGIRKVLGASVSGITALLAKDFIKLVLIAIVVASPLAWYLMQQWLQDFAYRIEIQWWMFVLAGALAVGIAFLTISFQSVKAALANPVKSLRSE